MGNMFNHNPIFPNSDSMRIVVIISLPCAWLNFAYVHLPHILIDMVASYHCIYSKFKHTGVSRLMVVSHKAKKKQHARASSSLYNHYSE